MSDRDCDTKVTEVQNCVTKNNAVVNCNTNTDTSVNVTQTREDIWLKAKTKSLEEFRAKLQAQIESERCVANITIHELLRPEYGVNHALIGKFKRKSNGCEYLSPRILLSWYFSKHIGKGCFILEGKVSVEGYSWLQNKDALILVLR